jgi:hypothetical protein
MEIAVQPRHKQNLSANPKRTAKSLIALMKKHRRRKIVQSISENFSVTAFRSPRDEIITAQIKR